jgi:hypothetical protein
MTQLICYGRLTNLLTDALVESYVAAQQIQITRDFAPIWGVDAQCVFVPPGGVVPAGAWQLRFMDHSDQAGDLGYHDDTGSPIAYVFVADDIADGCLWTVTASHETLEMLGDPLCTKTAIDGNIELAFENCDAVEDDALGYWVEGADGRKHLLSDFVTQSWFASDGVGPYSFRGHPTAPFQLCVGGYIGFRTLPDGAWSQRFAAGAPGIRALNKKPTSRTTRRFNAA